MGGVKEQRAPSMAAAPTIAERIAARLDLKLPAAKGEAWRRRADCGEG